MNARAGLLVLTIFVIHANSFACELNLVSQKPTSYKAPRASIKIEGNELIAIFKASLIEKDGVSRQKIYGPKEDEVSDKPAYEFDVVEIFVSQNPDDGHYPYYEFELTPHGRTYQVRIKKKGNSQEGIDLGMLKDVRVSADEWTATIRIPLRGELAFRHLDTHKLYGNFFAVLGAPPNRSYWSAFLTNKDKLNFHQPLKFRPLSDCKGEL